MGMLFKVMLPFVKTPVEALGIWDRCRDGKEWGFLRNPAGKGQPVQPPRGRGRRGAGGERPDKIHGREG